MTNYDVTTITIEKGVPMPESRKAGFGSKWLSLIKPMEIGDSIVVPNEKVANSLYNYFKRLSYKAAVREVEKGFFRVWRVK